MKNRLFIIVLVLLLVGVLIYILMKATPQNSIKNQKEIALQQAKKIFQECGEGRGGEGCYSERFKILTKEHDLDYSLQALSALEDLDPNSRGCHLIAHSITLAETQKDLEKWQDLLSKVDSNSCSGGFVHGVLEARSRLDSTFELDERTLPETCLYVGEKQGKGGEFNCSHIMGHILMAETGGKIPESVVVCSKIPADLQYECLSGVFMENMTRDNLIAHGIAQRLPWNKKTTQDQELICREYSGIIGQACWREIAHMYAFITKDNPSATYKLCNEAPFEKAREDCYSHAIGILTGSSRFDLSNMSTLCSPFLGNDNDFLGCVSHATNSMMLSSPKFADRVIRLCEEISQQYQRKCFQGLGDKLGVLVLPQEREQLCAKAPKEYKDLCLGK